MGNQEDEKTENTALRERREPLDYKEQETVYSGFLPTRTFEYGPYTFLVWSVVDIQLPYVFPPV